MSRGVRDVEVLDRVEAFVNARKNDQLFTSAWESCRYTVGWNPELGKHFVGMTYILGTIDHVMIPGFSPIIPIYILYTYDDCTVTITHIKIDE